MSNASESELLARCREGDGSAWDELFLRHYSPTAGFLFQLGYQFRREDVEELCQEVFLTVIQNLKTFQENCQFQTWLFRIAANQARDYCQRQHALKRGGGQPILSLQAEDPETGLCMDPPSQAPGPDCALLQSEKIQLLGQAVQLLGPACQEIIELRYFADLSYDEIAAALKLNPKTVSSRLSKCLRRLEAVCQRLLTKGQSEPFSV